ncbi:MAG: 2-oxoacid:acceptor oxidoreductase subunit alpha [Bacteroidales bacterium]|nr:2-oxoacid:acceptor oxidoreductase subunit alpha [Bacteroidales bacterium]
MNKKKNLFSKDVSIVLCGKAGQGIKTIELILVHVLKQSGYNVFSTKEYMSRVRGGSNSTIIRVSDKNVKSMKNKIDILIPLDNQAIDHVSDRLSEDTIILGDKELFKDTKYEIISIPFIKTAKEIGNKIYENIVACGAILALFNNNLEILNEYITNKFKTKSNDIIKDNIAAAKKGYELGKELYDNSIIRIDIASNPEIKNDYFLNGNDTIGFGALMGGCNFISSYPMSPGTGVLTFLSEHSKEMGIVVEQAEDEISAVNMSIGAWYAGARALVTTSGGGFALMGEGISLSGVLETPTVIHLAQRPGPGTGLPTRTEQGDLEVALYSGHGEFPRIILAPSSIENTIKLTAEAFNLADKYQSPVIILSDQYFLDTFYNTKNLNLDTEIQNHIIKTEKDYKRYEVSDSGISKRGIPGFGKGLVRVDSDEHDEEGRITEDMGVRVTMTDKRLKKLDLIKESIIDPIFTGSQDYDTLVIGWGSTYNVIKEALEEIDNKKISYLHFEQVYPISNKVKPYLKKAKNIIIIENNATAQFSKLLCISTGIEIKNTILKYNGIHFYQEELVLKINELAGDK